MSFLLSRKGLRLTQTLHARAFALFWLGQTTSALGDGAFMTALAVAVYVLTRSSLMMGLFLTAQITPELLFTLLGGVAADRLPKRRVLLWADAGRALAVFTRYSDIAMIGCVSGLFRLPHTSFLLTSVTRSLLLHCKVRIERTHASNCGSNVLIAVWSCTLPLQIRCGRKPRAMNTFTLGLAGCRVTAVGI